MDRISPLPDSVLLKILSFLCTDEVVATMVLSKRWQTLWTMVPKLYYNDDDYDDSNYECYSRFVDRSLLLHKAPIIENLHFIVHQTSGVVDIPLWTKAADKFSVREMIIEIDSSSSESPAILPRSLYTGCSRMLVTLKLSNVVLVDVSSPVSFPSLKFLILNSVKYPGDDFVKRLLSSCVVLEHLVVEQCSSDNVTIFTVRVPSLKKLCVEKLPDIVGNEAAGFVIDAPSLEFLGIHDFIGGFCVIENEMRNIVVAHVEAGYKRLDNIMCSINSVKRLYLCLHHSKDVYTGAYVFHRLERLTICTCEPEWFNTLMCLLRYSPKLQSLELEQCHSLLDEPRRCWIEPSSVPECLLTSLETLKWVNYIGTEEEKQVAAFILRNGSCLKNVTISSVSDDCDT